NTPTTLAINPKLRGPVTATTSPRCRPPATSARAMPSALADNSSYVHEWPVWVTAFCFGDSLTRDRNVVVTAANCGSLNSAVGSGRNWRDFSVTSEYEP